MKQYLLSVAILISTISMFDAIAEEKDAHHHDVSQQKLGLNHGEKWLIDESLHIGMTSIKQQITKNLDDIHYDRFSDQQYSQLAIGLDKQLTYLFKNCKLPPKADAQLHILLAQIMKGVGEIKQESNKKQGAVLIIQTLKHYPEYFNDPAWVGIHH